MPHDTISLLCHPDPDSFGGELWRRFNRGREAVLDRRGEILAAHHLDAEGFDPRLGLAEYRSHTSFDPQVGTHARELAGARHLVIFAPLWWGTLPANAWGWFHRVWTAETAWTRDESAPGTAHRGLLGQLSIHLWVTADQSVRPDHPLERQFLEDICPFSGARLAGFRLLGPMHRASFRQRRAWLEEAETAAGTLDNPSD